MSERLICHRWQEVVPDGTGLGSKLTYSCECGGVGCPDQPRPPAPPLTPAEQSRVAAFEAAPYPAEVADAANWRCPHHGQFCNGEHCCCADEHRTAAPDRPDTAAEVVWVAWRDCNCEWITKTCDELHLRGATVSRAGLKALAARRPATEAEQAVERVRALADELLRTPHTVAPLTYRVEVGRRIRAALDGAARDGSDG